MADQGPSKVGGQSLALATTTAAETSTPTSQTTCAILSQGEVSSRASAPSSSSAAQGIAMPVVENSAVFEEQSCKSSEVLMKPASRLVLFNKSLRSSPSGLIGSVSGESCQCHGPKDARSEPPDLAVVVKQYRAEKARQMDLYGKAEASLKEREAIEQEKQRLRSQIEADRLHRAKLILELQELERQTSASEPVIDALTSQTIAVTH
ncbi:Hypothetical predicted protein [Prunus dulcis]|uniref:Uncharacterized protein n=1 Tax=Prunus dulcis TaxID=3755 RepID=A0A5E4F4S6_PRUDU|nr:Hypothetical predicted protein [Prunus dulcis]